MDTAAQAELNLRTKPTGDRLPETDLRELCQLLRGRGTLTAREIEALRPGWADPDHRYVRRLASLSPEIVSGPGVKGYSLASETTLEHLERIAAMRHAQIRTEGRELIRLRRLIALRRAAQILVTPTQLS